MNFGVATFSLEKLPFSEFSPRLLTAGLCVVMLTKR
jgi:hypothetical protein